eukprot:gene40599-53689_t
MKDYVFLLLIAGALIIFWFSFLILDSKSKEYSSNGHIGLNKFTDALKLSYKTILLDSLSTNSTPISIQSAKAIEDACNTAFPPVCEMDPSLIYWKQTPDCYASPAWKKDVSDEDRKYVVFEPDLGGWNNIRMGVEGVIVFAHATGRTLVIPPKAVLYLLSRNKRFKDNKSSLDDFYNLTLVGTHGLDFIPMEEFLAKVASTGQLALPLPNNNTKLIKKPLWEYLGKACFSKLWTPSKYFMGINITRGANNDVVIGRVKHTPRLKAISLERQMVLFDEEMHKQKAIFFSGQEPNRLLTHFYAFFHFADPAVDRFHK